MGLDFTLSDADPEYNDGKSRKSQLVWHGGQENHVTPVGYGLIRLEPDAGKEPLDMKQMNLKRAVESRYARSGANFSERS